MRGERKAEGRVAHVGQAAGRGALAQAERGAVHAEVFQRALWSVALWRPEVHRDDR